MPTTRDPFLARFSADELAVLERRGELVRLRRGSYLWSTDVAAEPAARHRQLVEATWPLLANGSAISHLSGAVLHGLPVWDERLSHVQVTRTEGRGKRRGNVHVHVAPLDASEVVDLGSLRATSPARTVVDLGRTVPLAEAVAAGDAALRAGMSRTDLANALLLAAGRPGVAGARRVVELADPRSESAGESYSRVVLHEIGLPPSDLQYEVFDDAGRLVGRSDFVWEQHRTLGEFDGRVKYERLLKPGQTTAQAVYLEKRREDALRDRGWEVVRWSWADLQHPRELAARLQRGFRRGSR